MAYKFGRETRGWTNITFHYGFILHSNLIKNRYKNAINSFPNTFHKTSVAATTRIWTHRLSDAIHRRTEKASYKTSQPHKSKWSEYTSCRHSESFIYRTDASCLNWSKFAVKHSRNQCYQSPSLSQFTNMHSSAQNISMNKLLENDVELVSSQILCKYWNILWRRKYNLVKTNHHVFITRKKSSFVLHAGPSGRAV